LLKRLISVFTDPGDVVIDPCAGSGSTLRAAFELGRNSYGFEVSKEFYILAQEKMLSGMQIGLIGFEFEHSRMEQISQFTSKESGNV
jgi:site-specific DNA-methyltransferase (adenine-specific)